MTELYLIRHGESESNARGVIQGQHDAHLSARGREQASRLARRLALDPPDLLYSSDLSRALDTARAIAERCHLSIQPPEPRLREIDAGNWSNCSVDEIKIRFPQEWERYYVQGDPYFRRGEGECKWEVQERMVAAITEIVAARPGRRIAIVSHGLAIRTYLAHLFGIPLVSCSHVWQLDNSSITRLALEDAGMAARLLTLNDTGHLQEWAAL